MYCKLIIFTVTDAKYIALLNPKTDRCFWFDYYVKVFGVKIFKWCIYLLIRNWVEGTDNVL